MGVGFVVGGFCPGTSLVAAATLKVDGIFFVAGVLFGIFLFGESVGTFYDFFYSSYMGRFTLPDLFGLSTGKVVLFVVLLALVFFWGAEQLERIFGDQNSRRNRAMPRWRFGALGATLVLVFALMAAGQPTAEDRWNYVDCPREYRPLAHHAWFRVLVARSSRCRSSVGSAMITNWPRRCPSSRPDA